MCFGMGGGVAVPLGPKGLVLAAYLRILFAVLFVYSIIEFVGGEFVRGVMDLLVVLIGALAIKRPSNTAIDYTRLMCLMMVSVIRLIISIIMSALFFSSSNVASTWQAWLAVVIHSLGPLLWATSVALNGSLYYELKRIVNEMVSDGGESGMGGGRHGMAGGSRLGFGSMFGSQPAQQQQQQGQSIAESPAAQGYQAPLLRNPAGASDAGASGFRAFGGQGHRLS